MRRKGSTAALATETLWQETVVAPPPTVGVSQVQPMGAKVTAMSGISSSKAKPTPTDSAVSGPLLVTPTSKVMVSPTLTVPGVADAVVARLALPTEKYATAGSWSDRRDGELASLRLSSGKS